MRKISANQIITATGDCLNFGIVTIDDSGKILNIEDTGGQKPTARNIEFYEGVIVPGFVNAHCHLELSHTKGLIPPNTGLTEFIRQINLTRNLPADKPAAIQAAHELMVYNGIVAIGDISNSSETFLFKKQQSEISYHNFIELFKLSDFSEKQIIEYAENLRHTLQEFGLSGSLTPHAPYSVTPKLFYEIRNSNPTDSIISIHNQETAAENELFTSQTGTLKTYLESRGFDYTVFEVSGKSALKSILNFINPDNNILLIHNTFTNEEDIKFAENYSQNIYWTFCPNANLYIENRLPEIPLFLKNNVKICLGTDGYSSNTTLSVLEELKTIQQNFPEIPFRKLIEFATITGAKALKFDKTLGSLEIGKSPGLNLILDFDFELNTISKKSNILKLV